LLELVEVEMTVVVAVELVEQEELIQFLFVELQL
jgi:hypothetical protein